MPSNRLTATLWSLLACSLFAPAVYADPVVYSVDAGHTHVLFNVDRFGFANTFGVFPDSEGEISYDPDNPSASSVRASVKTASVWTGLDERNEHVRGSYWLNAEEHPAITFESTSVEAIEGSDRLRVKGNMTIWGETKPLTLEATVNQVGPDRTKKGAPAVGVTVHGVLKRSDFGHKTAQNFIGDEVTIRIETVAHAAASE